jgi:protein-tyrosine-phosphatase
VDAPILILDDALSSVDNQTATHILESLGLQREKTVIFISHQLSAAATADRIFVMDEHNLKDVLQLTDQEAYKNKVRLLLSILPSHGISAVPDPYYGNASGFQNVYDLLDMATDAVLKEITND